MKRAKRTNVASGFLLRVVLLASVAVIGSTWALVRFYTRVRPPMVVQAPADAGTPEWGDAAVIVAPDLEPASR